ncbi:MAG: FG-GAP-like repeat-containing protein, partial [Aurantibacter sp.]
MFFHSDLWPQCGSEPFPDQWSVHQLQSGELPYRSVYIYAHTDIDGDGRKDIVTGGWWYKNPGSASGNWVRNTIGSTFNNMAFIHDFDGDGDPDLLGTTGAYTGSDMVWARNNGSGSFTIHTNIPSGDTNYSEPFLAGIAGANFQSGGPFQMAINWNGAESTGSPVQMLTVPADPVNTQWTLVDISDDSLGEDLQKGDIDDDGDLDLFQSSNWLRNNGNGTWTTINTGISYVTTPDRAQLADFDGDGDLDAVVGQLGLGSNSARHEFAWFEAPSNPAQTWTRHTLATDINGSLSVFAEDIDLDGDDDIVVGEWKGNNRLIAFENDLCDSGTWIRHTLNSGGTGFDHHDGARVVDIDNDGDFDVVSIGWDNIVPRIFENTSSTSNNQDPLASAGSDKTITLPTNSTTMNGSGSDPDGGNVTFAWTQQSGPNTAALSNE